MPAPIITAAEVDQYITMLDTAEAMMQGEAPAEGWGVLLDPAGEGASGTPVDTGGFPDRLQGTGYGMPGGRSRRGDVQKTIAAAEQVLAKGDAAGVSFWTGLRLTKKSSRRWRRPGYR